MERTLGNRIAQFRKKNCMTQERLAAAVGVSAAAVSKWETGASQPDISLLCPLARALQTNVDTLLSFEKELAPEELVDRINAIGELARKGELERAELELKELLHAYPSSVALKFNASGVMTLFSMFFPQASEAKKEEWKRRGRQFMEEVRASGNVAYSQNAIVQLASFELLDENLDKAEALLKELPEIGADASMLWTQIYVKRGQTEKALEVLQKRLFTLVRQVQSCMNSMMLSEKIIPDGHRQLEICRIHRQIEEIFGVGGGTTEGFFVEIYRRLGMEEEMRRSMIKMIRDALGEFRTPNPVLFAPNVTVEKEKNRATKTMKQMLLEGLKNDENYEKYRQDKELSEAIELLRKDVEEG